MKLTIIHNSGCDVFACNSLSPGRLNIQIEFGFATILSRVFEVPLILKIRVRGILTSGYLCIVKRYQAIDTQWPVATFDSLKASLLHRSVHLSQLSSWATEQLLRNYNLQKNKEIARVFTYQRIYFEPPRVRYRSLASRMRQRFVHKVIFHLTTQYLQRKNKTEKFVLQFHHKSPRRVLLKIKLYEKLL